MRRVVTTLLVMGVLFALGLLAARYYLMEQHGLIAVRELGVFKGSEAHASLNCPRGSRYRFIIASPRAMPQTDVTGTLTIKHNGVVFGEWQFTSDGVRSTDWLNRQGIPQAFAVVHPRTHPEVSSLKEGETYQLTLALDRTPPARTSLWLGWTTNPR